MRILITGASGFIGKNLVILLSKSNFKIFALYYNNKPRLKLKNVKWIRYNVLKKKKYKILKEIKPETVLHLAWSKIPNFSYK